MRGFGIVMIFMALASPAGNCMERNYSKKFTKCEIKASDQDGRINCIVAEIALQKRRLNVAYEHVVKKLAPEDQIYLKKVQQEWITWRDDNYNFLSERVPGFPGTMRGTSLDFLLRSIFDRASELEMISDEIGEY